MQQRHRNEDGLLLVATETCAHWKVLKSFSNHKYRQYASDIPDMAWETLLMTLGHTGQAMLVVPSYVNFK
jgi:hypothetical protein